ncbi:MAG: VTC domain-containing protein [Kiritimatiellia bacterium]|jgi:hypothetical protein
MQLPFPVAAEPYPRGGREEAFVRENKFVAPATMAAAAHDVLRHHCLPDPKYPEGWIESIYFDTPQLTAYWEKANGDNLKRKIRVRWYPPTDPAAAPRPQPGAPGVPILAFFEVKDRLGAAREKLHAGFRMDGALLQYAPLTDTALLRVIRRQARAMDVAMAEMIVPTISIRYYRYRFVCPVTGTRISLDTRLVSDRCNPDLMPETEPRYCMQIVCEAKSPVYRNWSWSETLFRLGFRSHSFSKYGEFINQRIQGRR